MENTYCMEYKSSIHNLRLYANKVYFQIILDAHKSQNLKTFVIFHEIVSAEQQ